MQRVTLLLAVAALVVAALPAAAAATDEAEDPIYLSLGTSLAAGSYADATGTTVDYSERSYTHHLHRRMANKLGLEFTHVNLGCPNETTPTFVGGVNLFGDPSRCVDDYVTGSQLGDALMYLQTGAVELVTIDIGANDITHAQAVCQGDPECIVAMVPGIVQAVGEIVGALRIVGGYEGPIIAMTYYNPQVAAAIGFYPGIPGPLTPDLGLAMLTDQLAVGFNGGLAQAYAATGAAVADVYAAFNGGDFGDDHPTNGIPDTVDVICSYVSMCPDDPTAKANIHPTVQGYKYIGGVFFETLLGLGD